MNLKHIRWDLADILSKLACKLRGQKWYMADNMANCHGNRAAELRQSIWEQCVVLNLSDNDKEPLNKIDVELAELGQIAGENWGHRP